MVKPEQTEFALPFVFPEAYRAAEPVPDPEIGKIAGGME